MTRWIAGVALLWGFGTACGTSPAALPVVPDSGAVDAGSDAGVTSSTTALRNVDVTIIYPLPSPATIDDLIAATDIGRGGALLAPAAFDGARVPQLDSRSTLPTDEARLASLRVVAMRFDPCPGQIVPAPAPCQADLRLVFQSIHADGSARDGALHAFYTLTDGDRDRVLGELRALREEKRADPPVPLDVHPRLLAEGLRGAFASRLETMILTYAGASNLVRITQFRRTAEFPPTWDFALRERTPGGPWHDAIIPTTGTNSEVLLTISGGRWDADIRPAVSHADDPTDLFSVPSAERPAALSHVARLLNPRIHSSESVDCASCHVAPDIAIFIRQTGSLEVNDDPQSFRTTYSLDAVAKDPGDAIGFENIHMISYLGRTLSLASRTVHETAAVLEVVNDH